MLLLRLPSLRVSTPGKTFLNTLPNAELLLVSTPGRVSEEECDV
jgi:hypothetical protein